jgi:plasmid rolling circle replication initiator protein Rep
MSGEWGQSDLLTLPKGEKQVNEGEYLSGVSPKHKPWDTHRAEADEVKEVYAGSDFSRHRRYAARVEQCSQVLEFARSPPKQSGKQKLKLKAAWFCRVRHCPVCQWRRSLMWQAKVARALPQLVKDYPDVRFLFVTLTVRNCLVENLRSTLGLMGQAWQRMTQLSIWPALGWVRAVEITRGRDGSAHPHYHCLLMVPPSYFQADYLQQKDWSWLWAECLRINYRPVVDVRVVRPEQRPWKKKEEALASQIWGAIVEILKYAVKPSDMVKDHDWFLTLVDQVWKTRAVAIGGILKKYIKDRKKENLIEEPGEIAPPASAEQLFFGWKREIQRYRKVG